MSLLARVSSLEALSPERGRSPDGRSSSRDRKLSFSPLPGPWKQHTTEDEEASDEQQEEVDTVAAFDVPKTRRISKSHIPSLYSTNVLICDTFSTSHYRRNLLPLCSWNCIWLCSHQTRPHSRENIPQSVHARRTR